MAHCLEQEEDVKDICGGSDEVMAGDVCLMVALQAVNILNKLGSE